jgi:hypothetical protein
MKEKIIAHLDDLFAGAPNTSQVNDMKQELLAGCLDKFADLTAGGMDEEEAYYKVIGGIGDVNELLGYFEKTDSFDPLEAENTRKKKSFYTSAGICGFFIAVAMFFLFGFGNRFFYNGRFEISIAILLFFVGISAMLIIYGRMISVAKYEKADDTLVEEMKVQMSSGNSRNRMMGLAASSMWSLVVVVYFIISFLSRQWQITWLIFPFAAGLQNLISAYFKPKRKIGFYTGALWCFTVTLYFLISFATSSWHITWLVFPCAVAVQQAVKMFLLWRGER